MASFIQLLSGIHRATAANGDACLQQLQLLQLFNRF